MDSLRAYWDPERDDNLAARAAFLDRRAAVRPGDPQALCEGMIAVLRDSALARRYGAAARARLAANYDSARLIPRHAALAAMVANVPRT